MFYLFLVSISTFMLRCWDVPLQLICSLIWLLQTFCLYSFELLATEYWFEPGMRGRGTQESNAGRLQCTQGWSLKHRSLDGVEAFQAEIWTIDFHRGSFLGTISWVHKDAAPQRRQIFWVALAKETSCFRGWICAEIILFFIPNKCMPYKLKDYFIFNISHVSCDSW